ncbi:hypothetical protein ACIA5C_31220 [Actinoplanes sp. NPDC051343]|uniref:hypothetical protein n=1 Tax=Actinoplanes sp. NPDC051343 TaxID=3363906 RepID=UPI0037A2D4A1
MDTAKVVATFSVGIAATLTATALQVGKPSGWDELATGLLFAAFLAAIVVVVFDRLTDANHGNLIQLAFVHGWTQERLLKELQAATIAAVDANSWVLTAVRISTVAQVGISTLSGIVAVVSLLT